MAAPQPSEKCARSDRDMNLQRIDRKLDAYVIVGHIHTLFHLHRKRKKNPPRTILVVYNKYFHKDSS